MNTAYFSIKQCGTVCQRSLNMIDILKFARVLTKSNADPVLQIVSRRVSSTSRLPKTPQSPIGFII